MALDTPDKLKDMVGGDLVSLKAEDNQALMQELKQKYGVEPVLERDTVVFSVPQGDKFLVKLTCELDNKLTSISIRRPTLDDVFLKLTGRAIRDEEVSFKDQMKSMSGMRRH